MFINITGTLSCCGYVFQVNNDEKDIMHKSFKFEIPFCLVFSFAIVKESRIQKNWGTLFEQNFTVKYYAYNSVSQLTFVSDAGHCSFI
jgi:hypothetical protein